MKQRRVCSRAGFTLLELMVTVAVIVVLAGLALGTLGYVNRKGAEGRAKSEVASLSAALDSYKLDYGKYPGVNDLYKELTGQGTLNNSKVYIEPTPGMLITNGGVVRFVDPWGTAYNYRNPGTENVGFFDLWSTAGGKSDTAQWIKN